MIKFAILITLSIALYCIVALILKVPAFNTYKAFQSEKEKDGFLNSIIGKLSARFTPHIKMNLIQKSKIKVMLNQANSKQTPEEFLTTAYIKSALPLLFAPILLLVEPLLAVAVLPFCFILYQSCFADIKKQGKMRMISIESEMVKFVIYMSNALRTENNIINCMEVYKVNFDTPFTNELTYTIADMKTGSYEKALNAMAKRNNSDSISRLVRGLISHMRGNNTEVYFQNLGYTLTEQWQQSLERQVREKEPKISLLSIMFFGIAIVSVFTILINALLNSTSSGIFGGF